MADTTAHTGVAARKLVLCCDGTSNEVAGHQTNVQRLFRCLDRSADDQVGFYDPGVGTLADPMALSSVRKFVQRRLDGAIGRSLGQNFAEGYGFLVREWRPGDEIHIFGFSRGAYTARAIAGGLHMFGLLRPELAHLVPYVWAMYSNDGGAYADVATRFGGATRFRQIMARPGPRPQVAFMGLWDTVSSYGWFWDFRALPYTARNPSVIQSRHALALHERRVAFQPNLVRNADGDPANSTDVRQVWFPGVHADVGGGYPEADSGLAKVTLEWMLDEARAAGLRFDDADAVPRHLGREGTQYVPPAPTARPQQSLRGMWRLMEMLPRRSWSAADPENPADQVAAPRVADAKRDERAKGADVAAPVQGEVQQTTPAVSPSKPRAKKVWTRRWTAPHWGRWRKLPANAWLHPSVRQWQAANPAEPVPPLPAGALVVERREGRGWLPPEHSDRHG